MSHLLQNPPPLLPPPPVGGGEGEDHLSALPDDALHLILLRLLSAPAAARTSVLSRRWRHLWANLPRLFFPLPDELPRVRDALALHALPVLHLLHVHCHHGAPDEAAAVLHMAVPFLIGKLFFGVETLKDYKEEEAGEEVGAFEIPCFPMATDISISIGGMRICLPLSGVFENLTHLSLSNIRSFDGGRDIGDAVSSQRCPWLERLYLSNTEGLSQLVISSESLLTLYLASLHGIEKLTIFAPELTMLDVCDCFFGMRPFANAYISAPELETLRWHDVYHQNWVDFGVMAHLETLAPLGIMVYGTEHMSYNWIAAELLRRFQTVSSLELQLACPSSMVNSMYLMEDITVLPNTEVLSLALLTRGHAIGPFAFPVLTLSTGIRKLVLTFNNHLEEKSACLPGCICDKPQDWKTKDICLNFLQEVEVTGLKGEECELSFLKRLLTWAPVLKKITLAFELMFTATEEICEELLILSRPGICMEIYFYRNWVKVKYTGKPEAT